jgi:hypothetical protein
MISNQDTFSSLSVELNGAMCAANEDIQIQRVRFLCNSSLIVFFLRQKGISYSKSVAFLFKYYLPYMSVTRWYD